MTAIVEGIYSTSAKSTPLHSIGAAELEAGRGLVGDRYHAGVGIFSEKLRGKPDAEVTLIESEEIQRFNDVEGSSNSPREFRRNVVTRGIHLNDLVRRRFSVG
jgi:MOSC domain-containing protein YiiM